MIPAFPFVVAASLRALAGRRQPETTYYPHHKDANDMPSKFVPPSHKSKRFNCPRCGTFAAHEWREPNYHTGSDEHGQRFFDPIEDRASSRESSNARGERWEASFCSGCDRNSLWIGGTLAFPNMAIGTSVPEPAEGMPTSVEELYLEAAAVLPHSRRAAVALCRASLERLVKVLTPDSHPKSSLDERLVVLHERTTATLAQGLEIIRHVGNTALHGARDDDESVVIYMEGDESELIDVFFVTINGLVDELITRPARLLAVYNSIPAEKREAISRKLKASRSRLAVQGNDDHT